jgi:hypothetical protein
MNLKRGVLLSVAALMVGSVAVVGCTREHDTGTEDGSAVVDEACSNEADAPEAADAADDDATSSTVFAAQRRGREGPEGRGREGPGGPRQGWGPGGPEGPRQGWGEGPRGRGQGRGRMHGRRGQGRGRRGPGGRGRGQGPGGMGPGGMGEQRRLEREVRPWVRAVWAELMTLVEQARGRGEGP